MLHMQVFTDNKSGANMNALLQDLRVLEGLADRPTSNSSFLLSFVTMYIPNQIVS